MPGIIAKKVGMSRVFGSDGTEVSVTYLKAEPNTVVRLRTKERDGYNAVVLGACGREWKTRKGKTHRHYACLKEFCMDSLDGVTPGSSVTVAIVPPQSTVTISGIGKGKGFQGVMRRHHFSGGPATHGSHFKREPGSIGMRAKPGRVLRGHRMAGRMGGDRITIKHRVVVLSSAEENLLAVQGPIPGSTGSFVFVTVESTPSAS